MAEIRYGNLALGPALARVQGMGSTAGPPGGDGWTQIGLMPLDHVPAGSGSFALLVSGRMGDLSVAGSGVTRGQMQVCLGTAGGQLFEVTCQRVSLQIGPDVYGGVPFQFAVVVHATAPHEVLGTSWNPTTTRLALYARSTLNGDPQTYAAEFSVVAVSWLWFDLDRIPSTNRRFARSSYAPGTTFLQGPNPPSIPYFETTSLGPVGSTWLCLSNWWYEPRLDTAGSSNPPPRMDCGIAWGGSPATNMAPKVGGSQPWGWRWIGPAGLPDGCQVHHGAFFVAEVEHADDRLYSRIWEANIANVAQRTQIRRWTGLAVRIDDLPDFRYRSDAGPFNAGRRVNSDWANYSIPVERPAEGIITEPIVLAQQVPQLVNPHDAYGLIVTENRNASTGFGDGNCFMRGSRYQPQAVSCWVAGRRVFQSLSAALQWHVHAVGSPTSPLGPITFFDSHFVAFHPVRDPENLTTPPAAYPAPIVLTPGFQSAAPGSLPLPPHPPNANPLQRSVDTREQILGPTGYRRTWPIGSTPVRQFSLTWGPMPVAHAKAVFDFLAANAVWRYQPPRGVASSVLCMSRPNLSPVDHRVATVEVEVAVLVWTG
jgi:hypothetical protein